MDFMTARALQVTQLEEDQLRQLQDIENKRGYCIPNWNIQSLLGLKTLKDKFGIPEDANIQSDYSNRIKQMIVQEKLFITEDEHGNNLGFVGEINLEATHAFDWNVWNRRHNLQWDCGLTKNNNPLKSAIRKRFQEEE